MNIINYIDNLPESMEREEIQKYFEAILEMAESGNELTDEIIAEALWELSNKQWHTYTLIDSSIKARVESWVTKAWNPTNRAIFNYIIGVIAMLGIKSGLDLLNDALSQNIDEDIKTDIKSEIERLQGRVEDPYCNLRKKAKKGTDLFCRPG